MTGVLFMGLGKSAPLWYRCALPARALGADWVGVRGDPPAVQVLTGLVKGDTALPSYDDYEVVVLQQVAGTRWLRQINSLKQRGIRVLYEIDDFLHGVAELARHDFAKAFTKQRLKGYEICMRAANGLIVSTEYLGQRYARFNRNVYVCRNGIDLDRYRLTRPPRETITVGWAGGTGQLDQLLPWVNAILPLMREDKRVRFASIGEPGVAQAMRAEFGDRAIAVPFAPLEAYPAAMSMMDIAIAPAGRSTWWAAKSDLRFLEASALGIPIVADPFIYGEVKDGVTGLHASTPSQVSRAVRTLVADPELRVRIGSQAREYVQRERSSEVAARQWLHVFRDVP